MRYSTRCISIALRDCFQELSPSGFSNWATTLGLSDHWIQIEQALNEKDHPHYHW